jgi:hypothetical protein
MLSSEDLADILGLLHVNPELGRRRWFAVDAASRGDELRASARGEPSYVQDFFHDGYSLMGA